MISMEELGLILTRLAMCDAALADAIASAALKLEKELVPGDAEKVIRWRRVVGVLLVRGLKLDLL